jgi:hypothetical protein
MTGLSAEVSAPPVAADQHAFSPSVGGLLMNIDNGGTLTDFCVCRHTSSSDNADVSYFNAIGTGRSFEKVHLI